MPDLTARQQECLIAIRDFTDEWGFAPSIRDVAAFMGMAINGAQGHLKALEKKGYIRRDKRTARSIVILKEPE